MSHKITKQQVRRFSYYFCLMIEGSLGKSSNCLYFYQSGSVNQGYGSADPDPQEKITDQQKYRYLSLLFYCCLQKHQIRNSASFPVNNLLYFCTVPDNMSQKITKQQVRRFSYYFCLMIEGSGFVTLNNGSGSESRSSAVGYEFWASWIRIRIYQSEAWIRGSDPHQNFMDPQH